MKVLKDIFVSYNIAAQLEGIGFDEPCVAVYSRGKLNIFDPNDSVQWVMFEGDFFVPTWEQVFKWFRDKRYTGYVTPLMYGYSFFIYPKSKNIITEGIKGEIGYETYEQAQNALILKLIEIYKMNNGKS